jgi:hypothetical protein
MNDLGQEIIPPLLTKITSEIRKSLKFKQSDPITCGNLIPPNPLGTFKPFHNTIEKSNRKKLDEMMFDISRLSVSVCSCCTGSGHCNTAYVYSALLTERELFGCACQQPHLLEATLLPGAI